MSQIYQARRRTQEVPAAKTPQTAAPGPSIGELAAGARPTREQMGHRVDLPEAVREKMENAFGADFSGVRLYESQTVEDAGAEAMTQGQNIAFAPGKLDLTGTAGQALLGHELSHVVSQARGESAGHGLLADAGLETQADRQGMMAARGESVYRGPVSPIGTSSAMSAAGPMQAKKHEEKADIQMERTGMKGNAKDLGYSERKKLAKAYDAEEKRRMSLNMPVTGDTPGNIPAVPNADNYDIYQDRERAKQSADTYKLRMSQGKANSANIGLMIDDGNNPMHHRLPKELQEWFDEEFEVGKEKKKYKGGNIDLMTGAGESLGITVTRSGSMIAKMALEQGISEDEIKKMLVGATVKNRRDAADPNSENEEERARAASESAMTNEALKKIKGVYYGGIKSARDKYGVMMTQLHPADAVNQAGDFYKDTHWAQDTMNMASLGPELFDPDSEEDQEFVNLTQYYMATQMMLQAYGEHADAEAAKKANPNAPNYYKDYFRHMLNNTKRNEANVLANDKSGILKMGDKENRAYRRKAMQKHGNVGLENLFENEDESVDLAGLQAADTMPMTETEKINTVRDLHKRKFGK